MDFLKHEFNMNMKKDRLKTFSNWPFGGEGCNCTAEKVRGNVDLDMNSCCD